MPDFVLHKRGFNSENKLVIEFKNGKNMTQIDKYKLEALTVNKEGYGYVLGMFIKFGKQRDNVKISIFKNGREESEY